MLGRHFWRLDVTCYKSTLGQPMVDGEKIKSHGAKNTTSRRENFRIARDLLVNRKNPTFIWRENKSIFPNSDFILASKKFDSLAIC